PTARGVEGARTAATVEGDGPDLLDRVVEALEKLAELFVVGVPETVVRWHRLGFRRYWIWKSRRRRGRLMISTELRDLIPRMSYANPLWSAPRIHGELLKLGLTVSQPAHRIPAVLIVLSPIWSSYPREPCPPTQRTLPSRQPQVGAMDLRACVTGLGAVLAAPLAAGAQQGDRLPRIGFLSVISLSDPSLKPYFSAFRQALGDVGLVEGENITIEWRSADGDYQRLPDLAAELVRLKMDLV